tara:strand:+ start:891 stop:1448 length:558 start_codon:yes stop_codon:yes gene_type:complete
MNDYLQVGGEMNELMSTKMCSPMMIYLAIVIISAIKIYITRNQLQRHNTTKMDNLFNLYSLNEIIYILVFGIILFGLCQYNKTTLAWVFLGLSVIYMILVNIIIHIHVSSAIQSAPKEIVNSISNFIHPVPQDVPQQPMVPAMKQSVDMPVTTRSSQVLGGSGSVNGSNGFGGAGSSGGSNFAYF